MVIARRANRRNHRGMLTTEMVVAIGLLVMAMLPLSASLLREQKLCRAYYEKAVLMEILDGEMEALAAGEWRAFEEGSHEITINTVAAKALPAGKFAFTRSGRQLRLEWIPEKKRAARMVRETTAPTN
jgi:hypothetical protein